MFVYCNNSPVNNVDECGRKTFSINLLCIDEEQPFSTGAYIIIVTVTLESDAAVSDNQNGAFVRQSSNGIEYGLEDEYLSMSIEDGLVIPSLSVGAKGGRMQRLNLSYDFLSDSFHAKYSYDNSKGDSYSIDIGIYSNRPYYEEAVAYICEFDRRLSRAAKNAGQYLAVSGTTLAFAFMGGASGLLLQYREAR